MVDQDRLSSKLPALAQWTHAVKTRLPIVVLPHSSRLKRYDEAIAFLAAELFKAELRASGVFPPYPTELGGKIDQTVQSALDELLPSRSARQLCRQAEKKLASYVAEG